MKKILLMLALAGGVASAHAQSADTTAVNDLTLKADIYPQQEDGDLYHGLSRKLTFDRMIPPYGLEGIQQAMKYVPDVIICDVMMPIMDGMECCRHLKSEIQTSHIPVIMLTAYAADEQKIKGYECGADSYLSKPFNARLLTVRLRNLIENRHRLQSFFTDGSNATLQKAPVADIDKGFLEKLYALIDSHLSDPDLSVEELGEQIGLSRVQLYRKTKALCGYAPNELLRIARLKRAASLLAGTEKTIAEITYEVGFSSPSYFTKCYKEYFGENPTEFLKRKNGNPKN